MTKCMLAVLAALMLISPSAALAVPAPTAEGDIPLAEEFWGGPPPGCSSIVFGTEPDEGNGANAWQPPLNGVQITCVVEVTEVDEATGYTPGYVCEMVIHEFGHLHDLGHSPDPNSIMYGGSPLPPASVAAPVCVPEPVIVATPELPPNSVWTPKYHPGLHHHKSFRRGARISSRR